MWVLLIRSEAGWCSFLVINWKPTLCNTARGEVFGGFVSDKYALKDFARMHFSLKKTCAPECLRASPNSAVNQEENTSSSYQLVFA